MTTGRISPEEEIEAPVVDEDGEVEPTEPADPTPEDPQPEPEPKPSIFILYMNEGQFEIKDKNNLEIIEEDIWDAASGTIIKDRHELVLNPFKIAKVQGGQEEVTFKTELDALNYALEKFKDSYLEKLRRDYFTNIIYR